MKSVIKNALYMLATPTLHVWQSKHRMFGSLAQAWQSGFVYVELAVVVQLVGLMKLKLQSFGGLQQPDWKHETDHVSNN